MSNDIDYLLSPYEVARMLSISRPLINYCRKKGLFPDPIMLTPSTPRWRLSTVNDWIETKGLDSHEKEQRAEYK